MSDNIKVLIVGAGAIAGEYVKVLLAQKIIPIVVGRGENKVDSLKKTFPDVEMHAGGLKSYLSDISGPKYAIVATAVVDLAYITKELIKAGSKHILVEKPLSYSVNEVKDIQQLASTHNCEVYIAFNRRYYQSIMEAKRLISQDGGVTSFYFNFTEALFTILPKKLPVSQIRYLGIGNSCHPIDTAFYLCGMPQSIECRQYGKTLSWHPTGDTFIGMGETANGVPFGYHADWQAPGKWNIEIMTKNRRLIFSPMERLKEQKIGTFAVETMDLDYSLDIEFKPGYYLQVEAFLNSEELCDLGGLINIISISNKIFAYD